MTENPEEKGRVLLDPNKLSEDGTAALASYSISDDGEYLLFHITEGTDPSNRFYYKSLKNEDGEVVKLLNEFDASYNYITNEDSLFYFKTNRNAPRSKVIAINIHQPDSAHWQTVIPEKEKVLESVSVVNHQLIANYLEDAHSTVEIFDMEGTHVADVELPTLGTVSGFSGEKEDSVAYYSFRSFTYPSTVFKYDFTKGKSTIYRQPEVDFDPDSYVVKQEFYNSKDGTRIPMFIIHKKGLQRDGTNPTWSYGYGGFNISITPSFRLTRLVWMEMGGVYAVATLQEKHESEAPVLIRVETKAGHGAGKPTSKQIQEATDRLSFAAYHTGLTR